MWPFYEAETDRTNYSIITFAALTRTRVGDFGKKPKSDGSDKKLT